MGLGIKTFLKNKVVEKLEAKQIKDEQIREEFFVMQFYDKSKLEEITEEEKYEIRSIWGGYINSFQEYRLFKTYRGFDPRFLSHYLYLPIIARKLNDYRITKLFEDKGLQDFLVHSNLKSPTVYTRRISGEYYNGSMNQIAEQDAISICLGHTIIIKDSKDSSGGKSIRKMSVTRENLSELKREFHSRRNDFVVQECLQQSDEMAKVNPSSINTFRITTLYLNGKYSLLNINLRMGKDGSTVDNWGAGGIMVGVNPDGTLKPFGYDIQLNKYYSSNGVKFHGTVIKEMPYILKEVENAHKNYFSLCKLIGWDICIDGNGTPILIEVNSSQPGIIGEQLCNGPIFKDRTQEVVEYCKSKRFSYNRSLLSY